MSAISRMLNYIRAILMIMRWWRDRGPRCPIISLLSIRRPRSSITGHLWDGRVRGGTYHRRPCNGWNARLVNGRFGIHTLCGSDLAKGGIAGRGLKSLRILVRARVIADEVKMVSC